jgi:hypothetical protein
MSVVVRRADVAEKTAQEVDRLLLATPSGEDVGWLEQTAPKDPEGTMSSLREHPLYKGGQVRIVAAEIWSDSLPKLGVKARTPSAAVAEAPKKKGDKSSKSSKSSKNAVGTTQVTSAVAPANAGNQKKSLLVAIDPELGALAEELLQLRRELAALHGRSAQLDTELDAKDTTIARKSQIRKEAREVDQAATQLEAKISPKEKELLGKAKAAGGRIQATQRDRIGAALVNLRQAVDDASIANGAAALRYPVAIPTMLDSTKAMVPVFLGDVVQEKTGKRPTLGGLQPGVTLEGGNVQITLNGLTQSELGSLSLGDVTSQTISRTQKWVGHALGLLGTIGWTKETLSFEGDLIDALLDGMKAGGYTAPAPPTMPDPGPSPGTGAPSAAGREAAR